MAASGVQSVERALNLLDLLTDRGGVSSVSELAAGSGLSLPTAHRLLTTMEKAGYLQRYAGRKYALGTRMMVVGNAAAGLLKLRVLPYLERLVRETGETANAAALEGRSVVYFAQAPSPHPMRTVREEGSRAEMHASGVGKAILAGLADERADELLEHGDLPALTPNTIGSLPGMRVEIEKIRSRGYAVDAGEQDVGVRCVAVRLPTTAIHAAFSVSGPEMRVRAIRLERLTSLLHQVAEDFVREFEARG